MKPTFGIETRIKIILERGKKCEVCGKTAGLSFHHIIHNTKMNRKTYGDKIQSEENAMLLCENCHSNYSLHDRKRYNELKGKWNVCENN